MDSGSGSSGVPEVGTFSISASQTEATEAVWDPAGGPLGGTDFVFIVSRSGDVSAAATVDYTLSGAGLAAADFLLIGPGDSFPGGTLTFDPGQTEYVMVFKTLRDGLVEGSETLTITLSQPSTGFGLAVGSAQSVILDDDAPVLVGSPGADALLDLVAVQTFGPPETRSARLYGLEGNDTLAGQGGSDSLYGGAGDDVLVGGDTFFVSSGRFDGAYQGYDELLDGGAGFDVADYRGHIGLSSYLDPDLGLVQTETGVTVNLSLHGAQATGSGIDVLVDIEGVWGSAYADLLTGNGDANLLAGFGGADTLKGGAGDDTLAGGAGDDLLEGGGGFDTASYAAAAAGVTVSLALAGPQNTVGDGIDRLQSIEAILGSAHADSLTGSASQDLLSGGGGADTLDGGLGRDTLAGGFGDDLYRLDNSLDVIVEGFGGGTDTAVTSANYGLAEGVSIEVLKAATGTAALNLTGNAYAQTLIGNAGINTLDGKAGADTMSGGQGNDTYFADSAADVITELAGEGFDTVRTTAPVYRLAANLEVLTFAGSGGFRGTGNDLANVITGGAGIDLLDGGLGADRLIGGQGNDTYIVDNLGDVIVENAGEGLDLVRTAIASFALGANIENLTYTGSGAFQGFGNGLANVITGGLGNDTLDGRGGADRMIGGLGDDVYFVDSLADVVVETAGEGTDRVLTTLNSAVAAAHVETLMFIGSGNFQGFANATGTALFGAAGQDSLIGGAGTDLLAGRAGQDVLTGGGGADLFYFEGAGQGIDRITDFAPGVDHIVLRGTAFGVLSLADLDFVSGVAPVSADVRPAILYDTATGALYFDATGGDSTDQVQIAVLTGRPALGATDLLVL